MNLNLFVLVGLFILGSSLQNNNTSQHPLSSQLTSGSVYLNATLTPQLLKEIPQNNKPVTILNLSQVENPRNKEENSKKDGFQLAQKDQKKAAMVSMATEQKKIELKKKDVQQTKNNSLKDSRDKLQKQLKKQNSKQIKQFLPSENDIKIIPLTADYGKQKPAVQQQNPFTSQTQKTMKQNNKRHEVQTKTQKSAKKKNNKEKQTQKTQTVNQSKMIDKLIEDVKNENDKLHAQSKKEIIQYLQNKKQQSNLQEETTDLQTAMLSQKNKEETTLEHTRQYVLITDEVIQVNEKSKRAKQMDNSTILVIMVLTFIISIPIVREIRTRNDSHKEKHRKDSGTTLVISKQDAQKSEAQKQYNQINNESAYEIGEEMI